MDGYEILRFVPESNYEGINYCGNGQPDRKYLVNHDFEHYEDNITILIETTN